MGTIKKEGSVIPLACTCRTCKHIKYIKVMKIAANIFSVMGLDPVAAQIWPRGRIVATPGFKDFKLGHCFVALVVTSRNHKVLSCSNLGTW